VSSTRIGREAKAVDQRSNRDWKLVAIGVAVAGFGVYFGLVGFEVAPPPSRVNGPIWLALVLALIFVPTGLTLIVRALSGTDDDSSDLPDDAPVWMKCVYWLDAVIAAAGLATIASWVAFGPGTRHFAMSGPIFGPVGESIGRTVFGIGAIITWLIVLVFARAGVKKIFGRKDGG
jgi:hypothetical protein